MRAYINAKIHTLDVNGAEAGYLIVKDGRIAETGRSFEESEYARIIGKKDIIDLENAVVVPGFWESHLHIVDGVRSLEELNLRQIYSLEELRAAIISYAAKISSDDWIIGHGWDEKKLFGGVFPDRKLLDQLYSDKPVLLIRMDGHSLCLNSKGIDLMKIDKMTPSSEVPFDKEGKATGMLYENAANSVIQNIVEGFSEEYIENLVLTAQELFLQNGISSVNDICTFYGRYFDIYRKLQKSGKLKLRITTAPLGLDEESLEEFDQRKCDETDSLRIAAPKYFIDGSFGSRTALLMDEYADAPGSYGLQLIEKEQLKDIIMQNETINQPITIHAIGDKAVKIILDSIEETRVNNQRDIRNRIEHIQIIQESDIQRFSDLDVTASFQPVFLYEEELTLSRLGSERFPMIYRFKSFIEKGVNVIFNSDFPYGGGDMPYKKDNSKYIGFEPILGMHAACYRQLNKPESVEPLQALQCYTINPAFANYKEKELGKLAKGYFADFVVLSKDILNCSPDELLQTEVLKTIISGEIVYNK
ncbi:MAG: Amidohydrolase 3 [Clostridia bacterium]|jgi:predicted amidohydrolase YtcJ|nr:Amidohydrolase 3 [Clostridia bacterium]